MIRFTITIYALQNVASRISVNPWLHVKLIHIKHRMEHPLQPNLNGYSITDVDAWIEYGLSVLCIRHSRVGAE